MEFGVATFVTDEGIGPAELGRAVEERGFSALFVPEHTHIPVKCESHWGGPGEMPRSYYRTFDPFVALASAAAVTDRILLGTGVTLVVQRDPITLAKEVATLDHVSSGRAVLGIGAGWNREEMRDHGTDPRTRMTRLRERVLAMKEIWGKTEAEFHGEHVNFPPMYSWPKPLQQPHPPILVGGAGPTTFDRVLEFGDGWMPIFGVGTDGIERKIAVLRGAAADVGRDGVSVTVFAVPGDSDVVARLDAAGVDRVLFALPTMPEDDSLHALDELAKLAIASAG